MRKVFSLCVLMMTLLPLSGCFGGGEEQKALDTALTIRSEYLAAPSFTTEIQLHADYGQRVYDYTLNAAIGGDEIVLTVKAPELVSGVTARTKSGGTFLEYDGVCIETGVLNDEGLTPLSALPAMLRAIGEVYITNCRFEDSGSLRVDYGDPDTPPDQGTRYTLWFHPDTHDITRGEISNDGALCISCTFSPFTKE